MQADYITKKRRYPVKREKHGLSGTRIYRIWIHMRRRCNDEHSTPFMHYGAKGIKVCDDWNSSFISFYQWANENGYQDDLEIDRIDNSKGYSPDNCRWVTAIEQSRNRSSVRLITHDGRTQCVSAWLEELGISRGTFEARVRRYGMSDQEALKSGDLRHTFKGRRREKKWGRYIEDEKA